MATCCVCRGNLSWLVKKKGKKLNGLACKESRHVLEEEVNETLGLGLDGLVETGLDSFICKNCDAKQQKTSELKLQIEHLKSELQSYVASLHRKPSASQFLLIKLSRPVSTNPSKPSPMYHFTSSSTRLDFKQARPCNFAMALWLSYCPRI